MMRRIFGREWGTSRCKVKSLDTSSSMYTLLTRVETRAWGTDGLLVFQRVTP